MQIKIEIDVRPEELRRFLGLPDVAGLQEDVIHFLRTKVGQASENFDASAFVKGNIDLLSRNATVRKLLSAVKHTDGGTKDAPTTAKAKPGKAAQRVEQKGAADAKAQVQDGSRGASKTAAGKVRTKRPLAASKPVDDTKNQPPKVASGRVPSPQAARQGSELGADLSAAVSMAEDALKRGGNRLKMAALKGIPKGLPASAMKIAGKAASKSAATKSNPNIAATSGVARSAQDQSSQDASSLSPAADKQQK